MTAPTDSPVACKHMVGEAGITDSITPSAIQPLPGPAVPTGYLGQAQAQTVLFTNMVNQQQQQATLAAEQLAALEHRSDDESEE